MASLLLGICVTVVVLCVAHDLGLQQLLWQKTWDRDLHEACMTPAERDALRAERWRARRGKLIVAGIVGTIVTLTFLTR